MHTRYVLTLCTALVVGGALITGSAHALDQADEKTPINDTWLTAKTKIALAADGRVKGRQIDVATTKNVVMLRLGYRNGAMCQCTRSHRRRRGLA